MSFAPTLPEQNVVTAIFNQGDPQKLGIINGENAVKILTGAKLPPTVLGEIWAISDSDNNGFLTRKGVAVAVRLIGWAQKGETVKEELLNKVGPLAQIEGLSLPVPASSPVPPSAAPATGIPPLTPADRTKFIRLFVGCGPANGLITGEKARDVFVKSKLPMETLGHIWNLADTQSRGTLDQTDFIIGMFFIQLAMSQPSLSIPAALPPNLYEQASGGRSVSQPVTVKSHGTGGSTGLRSPVTPSGFGAPVKPQYTGQALRQQATGQTALSHSVGPGLTSPQHTGAGSRVSFAPTSPPSFPAAPAGGEWAITPQEKATSDTFFASLDLAKRGYIEGDTAVPFFLKSNLPEAVLAQIWDLADFNDDGHLTQDGFAIALHLINNKLTGKEVPDTLPQNLVPSSIRKGGHQLSEIQQDLWLLGDSPPPTGHNPPQPFQPQATGGRAPAAVPQHAPKPSITSVNHNFFDDDDVPRSSSSVPDHSVQIGNVQNQLDSTNKSLNTTKADRESLDQSVTSSAAVLAQLETQLAASKAAYETETKLVADLRIRYATQTADINKAREETIRSESDLSALRQEKAEIESAVLRDKEEVRDLQRKMKQIADETGVIKKEIERVKRDARHQKGLLAIGKKQVTTAEGERDKQEKELEVAKQELELATKEVEDAHAAEQATVAEVAAVGALVSPPAVDFNPFPTPQPRPESRASSITSPRSTISKNPFDKLLGTSTPRSASLFAPAETTLAPAEQPAAADDDPFGFATAFASEPVTTPPPIASRIMSPAIISTPPRVGSPLAAAVRTQSPAPIKPSTPQPVAAPAPPPDTTEIDEASRFPALESVEEAPSTDLPPLREIQQQDSDSDSDSDTDSDDRPLAESQALKAKQLSPPTTHDTLNGATPRAQSPSLVDPTSPAPDSIFATATEASIDQSPTPRRSHSLDQPRASTPAQVTPTATPGSAAQKPAKTPFDLPTPKTEDLFSSFSASLEPKTTTISDFDEAFRNIGGSKPNGTTSKPSAFKFEDTFEETFDFGSSSFPPVDLATPGGDEQPSAAVSSQAAPQLAPLNFFQPQHVNGVAKSPAASASPPAALPVAAPLSATMPGAFDSVFATMMTPTPGSAPSQPAEPSGRATPPGSREPSSISSWVDASPTTSMANSTISTNPRTVPPAPSSPTSNGPTPSSPIRATSRASKKDAAKLQAPPPVEQPPAPKHSKFYFPGFGRSKTQKKQKSTSSAAAYAPVGNERPSSSRSPSILDPTGVSDAGGDVEGVKRIMEMGFTRDQAVGALEKHSYDLRLALSDLLGEPTPA